MPAAKLDLYVEQGATFRRTLTWTRSVSGGDPVPYDLTGATARMQIRPDLVSTPFASLTTENGGISLGGTAGTIELYLSDTQTDTMTTQHGIYDLEVKFPDGDVRRVLEGSVNVSLNVTRDA